MTEPVDLFFAKAVLKDKINDLAIQQLAHLMAMTREGHTCVKREECAALPLDLPSLHYTEKAVYLKKMWQYEETFCTHMHRLLSSPVLPVPFTGDPDLNLEQQKAVINALAHPFTIITGGPGTGKTFTAARIVKHLGMPQVVVAAPTGKAAANLEKGIGRPVRSGTLHSLLQIRSAKDFQNPYPYISADLLIVDECSMIDCQMFTYLLSALEAGKRVVLIGDRDQLPPVEGGSFFSDLIDSGVVPVTKLEICMRSDRREILEFAEAIRQEKTYDAGLPSSAGETVVPKSGHAAVALATRVKRGTVGKSVGW